MAVAGESGPGDQTVEIRVAGPEDWLWLADFNCRLAEESEGRTLDAAVVAAGVQRLLQHPRDGWYLIACVDGVPVGQLMCTSEWSDWRNGYYWWLQSVYVRPDFRKQRIFRRLFERLQANAAAAENVIGLRLYVEHENAVAQEVYRRLGLRPAGYHVLEQCFTPE